jgi:hypothetical protein
MAEAARFVWAASNALPTRGRRDAAYMLSESLIVQGHIGEYSIANEA